jgi:hypothetical protein
MGSGASRKKAKVYTKVEEVGEDVGKEEPVDKNGQDPRFAETEASAQEDYQEQDDLGFYIVDQPATVSDTAALGGNKLKVLEANMRVEVLETVTLEQRLRARIAEPAPGWFSLMNMENGYTWAHKEGTEDDIEYFDDEAALGDAGDDVPKDETFSARAEQVIDWESINGPALRKAVPMLVALDQEGKCDPWLWRPLHYAALHGLVEALERLIRHGAVVDSRTGGHAVPGETLSRSTFNFSAELECELDGSRESVSAEEVHGDYVTIVQPHSNTRMIVPMGDCRCIGHSSVQHSTHTRHFIHATALHIAVQYQHITAIEALLSRRADPNTKWNNDRDVPLHVAISQGHGAAVSALLEHKADPNVENCWGHVPLATAALVPQTPSRKVAIMLLEAGARRAKTDKSGKTAAQLARELGHSEFSDAVENYVLSERAQESKVPPVSGDAPLAPEQAPPRLDFDEASPSGNAG